MNRRAVRLALNVGLLASFVGVTLTGFVSDQLDVRQFVFHRQLGYAMAVLAFVHIGLHWRYFPGALRGLTRAPQAESTTTGDDDRDVEATEGSDTDGDPDPNRASTRQRSVPRRRALVSVGTGVAGTVAGWTIGSELSPNPYDGGDVGQFYHRESSLGIKSLVSNLLDWGRSPGRYKPEGDGRLVTLPEIATPPEMTVADALDQRRSLRDYADRAMRATELAWVIRAAT